jgi:hypothetical protein
VTASLEALATYGTTEAPTKPRLFGAGPLTFELENGQLRYLRWHGVEVLRAIAFAARDSEWGTPEATIADLAVEEKSDRIVIRYDARIAFGGGIFVHAARIEAEAAGRLVFAAQGGVEGKQPILTNRTGFVVLHPIDGIAGATVTVTHGDGGVTRSVFPEAIAPFQPFTDVRSLSWTPAPGCGATCVFHGDVFETEDHRNWGDASFKTYVRPLALGFPYVLAPGERLLQSVEIGVAGQPRKPRRRPPSAGPTEIMTPEIGLAVDAGEARASLAAIDALEDLRCAHLTTRFDGERGDHAEEARAALDLAGRLGARAEAEIVIAGRDPDAELAAIASGFRAAGFVPQLVAPVPRRDFRSRPRGLPEGEASIEAILAAARRHFPAARLLAGSPVLFTELNRNPPHGRFDVIGHGFSAIVHAADDRSVLETLETIPAMAAAMAHFAPGLPRRIGLAAIGLRDNPSGATAVNPGRRRICMARDDPRHHARFGAAFAVAFAATAARAGIASLTLAAITGPQGLLKEKSAPTPLAEAFAALTEFGGKPVTLVGSVAEGHVALLDGDRPALVASLSAAPIDLPALGIAALAPFAVLRL